MTATYVNDRLPRPDPALSPDEAVDLQLDALRSNDVPYRDSGIETLFSFTSSPVQRAVGPLARFADLVHGPHYRSLVDFERVGTTPVEIDGEYATQEVTVVDSLGRERVYEFRLVRQHGGVRDGCWLTEAVSTLA